MSQDSTAPATKTDVAGLMDSIGRLYDDSQRWKDEILESRAKSEMRLHEQYDRFVERIEKRLQKLEERIDIVEARLL
jgi:hypothetical protein